MDTALALDGGIYATTFLVCAVSAVVPAVNAELYLLAVGALVPPSGVVPIVLLSASGQMLGKTVLYLAGRGVLRLPFRRYAAGIDALRASLERRQGRTDALLFVSALAGIPPFYAVAIAAGALRLRLAEFLACGLAGRTIRFGIVVLFPQTVKGLLR